MELPAEVQKIEKIEETPEVVLKSINTSPEVKTATRQVFGASRLSHTDSKGESKIDAKLGNTLAKAVDDEKLKDSDADNLPTPTEAYLVSQMPQVLTEIKPEYPKEAREKQIEGAVVLDILIDTNGVVRDAKIIEGEEIFNDVALLAIKKFKFRPASVQGQTVPVRIRYTLRFKLDY